MSTYALPEAVAEQVKTSPYPSAWEDEELKNLFIAKNDTENNPKDTGSPDTPDSEDSSTSKESNNIGAIAGGVVGGVVAVALIVGVVVILRIRRKRAPSQGLKELKYEMPTSQKTPIAELYTFEPRRELDGGMQQVFELDGGDRRV